MYAVIMAGGGGTRLWPLSRSRRPKPFLPLLEGERTLLEAGVDRLSPLIAPEDVFVVRRDGVYHMFAEGKGDIAELELPEAPEST